MQYRDLKVIKFLSNQYRIALGCRDSEAVMKLLDLLNEEMDKPMKPIPKWGAF